MKKKLLALLLTSAMAVSVLAGCGAEKAPAADEKAPEKTEEASKEESKAPAEEAGKTVNGVDISEHVDLTMYLVGDVPEAIDDVYAEVNKILEEELNCSLTVEWLSWAEHGTAYSLLFSSGEEFDLIFTAPSWCHYEQTVALGGFKELDEEFLQTYCPNIWEEIDPIAWEQAKIDGKVYMIPQNSIEVNPTAVGIRGDLMEKYGYDNVADWETFKKFALDCAADGMYVSTFGQTKMLDLWNSANSDKRKNLTGTPQSGYLFQYNPTAIGDNTVSYFPETEAFKEFCYEAKEMADAGCWNADILGTTESAEEGLLNGRAATVVWNTGSVQIHGNTANTANPDWNVSVYNLQPGDTYTASKYTNNAIGINAASKNPERAAMVINLFQSSQEIMDLTSLGIEGVHWKEAGDGQYEVLAAHNPSNYWGWKNDRLLRTKYAENASDLDKKVAELNVFYKQHLKPVHVLDGFSFDATAVSTEFAALEAALGNYWFPLINGLAGDVDKAIADMNKAAEAAGLQAIKDELQKQVDAFVAK